MGSYKVYRCLLCKENDTWFSANANVPEGREAIIVHMREEHGEDVRNSTALGDGGDGW